MKFWFLNAATFAARQIRPIQIKYLSSGMRRELRIHCEYSSLSRAIGGGHQLGNLQRHDMFTARLERVEQPARLVRDVEQRPNG